MLSQHYIDDDFLFFQQISVDMEDDADCSTCPGDSASVCLFLLCT